MIRISTAKSMGAGFRSRNATDPCLHSEIAFDDYYLWVEGIKKRRNGIGGDLHGQGKAY
jgi:hypothetical protein